MAITHTGQEIFNSITSNATPEPTDPATGAPGTSETNMFKILDSAIASLKTPIENDPAAATAQSQVIANAQIGIKNSQNNVLTVVADVGTKMNELEKLDTLGDDRALGQTKQMSDLVDVDWNEAISSYTMQQAALQASYKAFSDMQGMSLFQLNK